MILALASLLTICASCTTLDQRRNSAAISKAISTAPTNLPKWPAYCRDLMPTVAPKEGEKWVWVQGRWEIVRDNENKRVAWCAGFYDDIRNKFGSRP